MMRDPAWSQLARRVEPAWSAHRAERAQRAIARKGASRRVMLVAASVAVCALAVGFASRTSRAPVALVAEPAPAKVVEAVVTPLSSDAIVTGSDRAYVVASGTARFVVRHDDKKPFTVHAAEVVIEDLGTVFTVTCDANRVNVAVTEGSVRVRHDGIASDIGAGEHIDVAAHVAPPIAEPTATVQTIEAPRAPRDEVAPLLRAADDARADGHAESALAPLRRILREHPSDPRAGIAAFTLGRLLLDELDRPSEAADAFATARAHGAMAEDALAREVKARARAGQTTRARELADEYAHAYPHGDRAKEVARFGSPR